MKPFYSRLIAGRRAACLPGRRGSCPPAFLSSRGRRPAREIATRELRSEWSISKPGQAQPPPPELAGGLSASPAKPCRRPRERAGGHHSSKPGHVPPPPGGMAALEASLRRVVGVSRL